MMLGFGFWLGQEEQARQQPGFDPAALFSGGIPGVCYDASELGSIWQDAARTVGGAVGSPVGAIDDLSGNGHHAIQSNPACRPLLRFDAMTGAHYLEFDGIDDWLQTGLVDLTGVNKVSIIAGVRKERDTAAGILCEFSANFNTSTGSFYLAAPEASAVLYSASARGTATGAVNQRASTGTIGASPDRAVLTCTHDIAAPLSTLRRNAVPATSGPGSKGTGNFGRFPLFIGRRGGTLLSYAGRIYSLVAMGKLLSGAAIAQTERWTARRTGASLG